MPITIDGFVLDTAESETHSFDNEVTEHPVEKGADMADHIRARPDVVTVNGIVTDSPIGAITPTQTLRSTDALAKLKQLRDSRNPITIETSLGTYTGMVLEQLNIPRDASVGYALRFSATFRRVFLVTNERTVVRVATDTPGVSKKRQLGHKASAPVPSTLKPFQSKVVKREDLPFDDERRWAHPVRRSHLASGYGWQ